MIMANNELDVKTISDVEKVYITITGKQQAYNDLFNYYDGNHPLHYSTDRLRRIFSKIDVRFVENWLQVVVDSALDRIRLQRFSVTGDDNLEDQLNRIFVDSELNLDSYDCHLASLITGEGFIIVWDGETQGDDVEAYYNDPRMVHVEYLASNPRVKKFAAKMFPGEDGKLRITMYYPDRLEYYTSMSVNPHSYKDFKLDESVDPNPSPNPYGIIPVFHFRKERRKIRGDIEGVRPIQDAINKLLADMMVAAEFGAFRQRWIISNADTQSLRNAPNEIWSIPAGDGIGQQTQVGDFEPTDLNVYIRAVDHFSTAIAIISRTPKHFFYGQGGDPSGESLIALEAPLNDKCSLYIDRFKAEWRKVAEFIMLLIGQSVSRAEIEPIFANPQTIQPLTQAQIRKTNVEANIPIRTTLRREEGWSDAEIEQLEDDRTIEAQEQRSSLARAVIDAAEGLNAGQQASGLETVE
jgi:hypothetical protein